MTTNVCRAIQTQEKAHKHYYKQTGHIETNGPITKPHNIKCCRCPCSLPVPPAPPGANDLWELQFCRWWGWNWVRKQEELAKQHNNSMTKPKL